MRAEKESVKLKTVMYGMSGLEGLVSLREFRQGEPLLGSIQLLIGLAFFAAARYLNTLNRQEKLSRKS